MGAFVTGDFVMGDFVVDPTLPYLYDNPGFRLKIDRPNENLM